MTEEEKKAIFEVARQKTGRPDVPEFSDVPEDMRLHFKSEYRLMVLVEATKEKKKDVTKQQRRWAPWFNRSPGGFRFSSSYYGRSYTTAGFASRLSFDNEEESDYSGENQTGFWEDFIDS